MKQVGSRPPPGVVAVDHLEGPRGSGRRDEHRRRRSRLGEQTRGRSGRTINLMGRQRLRVRCRFVCYSPSG
jgi:hypothetical protein